ncbi:MAG: hypothetical protein HY908_04355 [Myxococcales bacterium]|nr:hypothetical protein [Myxococcales bacterium]
MIPQPARARRSLLPQGLDGSRRDFDPSERMRSSSSARAPRRADGARRRGHLDEVAARDGHGLTGRLGARLLDHLGPEEVAPNAEPAEHDEIFRPFYRVGADRDRRTGGVGIGLAITERAVTVHGGKLGAENASGGGLLATFRLPL